MRFVITTLCLLLSATHFLVGQSTATTKKGDDCSNWFEKVYPFPNVPEAKTTASTDDSADMAAEVKEMMSNKPSDPDNVSVLTEDQAISAMACLLQLENDHDRSRLGWIRPNIAELFGPPTVNLSALYYISYIFTTNFKHANAIALRGSHCGIIRDDDDYYTKKSCIHKAYKAYRRWFAEVKRIGLDRAREQHLDPLGGTGITWY